MIETTTPTLLTKSISNSQLDQTTNTVSEQASGPPTRRIPVAIIGAGYIADYHVEVLRQLGTVEIVGACDPNSTRLHSLCERWQIPNSAPSLGELLRQCDPQAVHVLVPPPLHFAIASDALSHQLHTLVEKPMALQTAECEQLAELARSNHVRLAVNHNAVYHPAFRKLQLDISRHAFGQIEHVISINNLPLEQLKSGDHDHWMFREPNNILLEQAVHPLSQICELLGAVRDVTVIRTGQRTLNCGSKFFSVWQLSAVCERGTAQIFLSFDASFPEYSLQVIGQDGTACLNYLNNTYVLDRRTKYIVPVDSFFRSCRAATKIASAGVAGLFRYAASTLRLRSRSDPYYLGMLGSIEAFYRSVGRPANVATTARLGLQVIAGIEMASSKADAEANSTERLRTVSPSPTTFCSSGRANSDVLVLGGTGFIGRRLVEALSNSGYAIRLFSRRNYQLSPQLPPRKVTNYQGDIRDAEAIACAVEGCQTVIHLVSGAPTNWAEYERLFLDGTRNVAEACLRHGVPQLLFASSIAAYYLGRRRATITEATALDESPRRAEYTRAKVECERLLMTLHQTRGLQVTIFRPGVVVGAGGPVEHLGVGNWPSPTHCVSWGRGISSPLPFVLVDDVVSALISAVGRNDLHGQSFNLVGDVRLTAREYVNELCEASRRDIKLHRQSILKWYLIDFAKWLVKFAARKTENAFPSWRDLASRSLRSHFDNSLAKQLLHWNPETDRNQFIKRGIQDAVQGQAGK